MTIQNSVTNSGTSTHVSAHAPQPSDKSIKSYLKNVFPLPLQLTQKTANPNTMNSPVSKSSLFALSHKVSTSDPVTMRLDSWVNEAGSWSEKRERRKFAAEIRPRAEIDPEGHLVVNEYLHVDMLKKVTALPEGLKVNGDFYLYACRELKYLPANLEILGNAEIIGSHLVSLPENFKVAGELGIFRSFALQEMKPGLDVGAGMELYECFKLEFLSENGRVGRDFKWHESSEAKRMPENFSVGGTVTLSNLNKLSFISRIVKIGGDLNIYWCNSLPLNLNLPEVKGEIKYLK